MFRWFWQHFRPEKEPEFDPYSRWEEVMAMADRARSIPLTKKLTEEEVKAVVGEGEHWDKLQAIAQVGDEFWRFHSPEADWKALRGRSGVALLRGDQVIATVITLLN